MIKFERLLLITFLTIQFFYGISGQVTTGSTKTVDYIPTLSPEVQRKIKEATPKPLPQETKTYKQRSDAGEDRLKGSVKRVIEQVKGYGGDGPDTTRHFTRIVDYDARGNAVTEVRFYYKSQHYEVIAYGYIDGIRVSRSGARRLDNPFVIPGGKPTNNPVTQAPDDRYDLRYTYTYTNGLLSEMQIFHNDGSRGMRYTYETSTDSYSKTGYDEANEINSKYVWKLDKDGNEIQRTDVDVNKFYGGDSIFMITYKSFDSARNWTERTLTKIIDKGTRQTPRPVYTEYRIITYY